MSNAWLRVHQLNDEADAALQAATGALGTPDFARLLAEYHRAMEEASTARLLVRQAAKERAGTITDRILRQRRSGAG